MNPGRVVSDGVFYASLAACCGLVLIAVGQPIFTDDLWWHLGLGAAYAEQGPWLDGDPLLFTATGAPSPTSWLADLAFFAGLQAAGFTGLRALHVGLVVAILALVWTSARRAGGSLRVASGVTTAVALLSSYRLFQLRPHLFTILAALLLYRILLRSDRPASAGRILAASLLLALWANLHAGFPLGLALIAASLLSLALAAPFRTPAARSRDLARARGLGVALTVGLIASLLNPSGHQAYLDSLAGGGAMMGQVSVVDEWRPTSLLTFPVANLPPSLLSWCLVWALLAGTALAVPPALRGWGNHGGTSRRSEVDPVQLGLALGSMLLMLLAVRFLWLGVFPLLFLVGSFRGRPALRIAMPTPVRVVLALLPLLLVPAFLHYGGWPMISNAISGRWEDYRPGYPTGKYSTHAAWLMADSGLEGNLFARYVEGGFLGYWLAPSIRTANNGSLNASPEAFQDFLLLRERRGSEAHPDFLELLDAWGFDLFLGSGLPVKGRANRPPAYTTLHLDGAHGWLPVFRNLRSALYLRNNPRNEENLRRIQTYYAEQRVPFDPQRGFDSARVIREAPEWAQRQGLLPSNYSLLLARASAAPAQRAAALDRLAGLHLLLGLSAESREANEALLALSPRDPDALRRQLWLQLQAFPEGDTEELASLATRLVAVSPVGRADRELVAVARRVRNRGSFPKHVLPWLAAMRSTRGQALLAGVAYPELRPPRPFIAPSEFPGSRE